MERTILSGGLSSNDAVQGPQALIRHEHNGPLPLPSALRRIIAHMTDEAREIFSGMVRRYGAEYLLNWWEGGGLDEDLEYFRSS